MKRSILLTITAVLMFAAANAQSVGINNDGSAPDKSAMLDVKNPNKGLLVPRVVLTGTADVTTIPTPATSLLVYNTTAAGSGGTAVSPGYYYWNGSAWTGTFSSVSSPSSVTYTIGQDIQGGKIFWLDDTKQHGLVVSLADQSAALQWSNGSYINTQAVRSGIYGGYFNTNHINDGQGNGSYASLVAAQYSGGSFGDWYLPSKEELNLMFQTKTVIGNVSGAYWSSSEVVVATGGICDMAWIVDLSTGTQTSDLKTVTNKVRAIRRF